MFRIVLSNQNTPQKTQSSQYTWHLGIWHWSLITTSKRAFCFTKPPAFDTENQMKEYLQMLKDSLSLTLVFFYPLAGRLATVKQENPPVYSIYVDCTDSPGARFIHASVDLTVNDILLPKYVPKIVESFFDHDRAINHDGHTMSLLTIQVTELIDGIFIGCSMNHMLADGTSYWHFFNSWSEIFQGKGQNIAISKPPIHNRMIPEGYGSILSLGAFSFVRRDEAPQSRERIFHYSSESLAKLKGKANSECNATKISTLQALLAHVWRCITRARNLPPDQRTCCRMPANCRSRLNPPLSEDYFGNCLIGVEATATSGELLERELGWAAWLLYQAVANCTDRVIREWVQSWVVSPIIYLPNTLDPCSIKMASSPRFNVCGNEFGLGKAVALRSGFAGKYNGKVNINEAIEGDGSMDLDICLSPNVMSALESDKEFIDTVSLPI